MALVTVAYTIQQAINAYVVKFESWFKYLLLELSKVFGFLILKKGNKFYTLRYFVELNIVLSLLRFENITKLK